MKCYVNHNGHMLVHPQGTWCKVFDKNKLVAKMASKEIVQKNYIIKLEEKQDEMERTLRATTSIIDNLQKQLKINRTMRKDAQFGKYG